MSIHMCAYTHKILTSVWHIVNAQQELVNLFSVQVTKGVENLSMLHLRIQSSDMYLC